MVRKGFRPEEIILRLRGADVRSGKARRWPRSFERSA